ncbi:MAG: ATP synthase F0 subunit B [Defluviitaleaceae bacterium]|nr:ATP synthase F0 subunit B [Defluviitaleaceae bacterium]
MPNLLSINIWNGVFLAATEAAEFQPLSINIWDSIFVAFNLLVIILVLSRVLFKPVNKILAERQAMAEKTEQDSEEAAKIRAEMENARAQQDRDMKIRADELLREARSRAGVEYDRIVKEAEDKALMITNTATQKAKQEQERIMLETKKQVAAVAMEAAGILLRSNMDNERNKILVEDYLAEKDVPA